MTKKNNNSIEQRFEKFAVWLTNFTGKTTAFLIAVSSLIIWGVTGPVFSYSDTWQLVINTGTTIVTFLMVFLIQRAQNKDSMAIQLKLNEIISASEGASNRLVDVEDLSEKDLELLKRHYKKLAALIGKEVNLTKSHSIEEAESRHNRKLKNQKKIS